MTMDEKTLDQQITHHFETVVLSKSKEEELLLLMDKHAKQSQEHSQNSRKPLLWAVGFLLFLLMVPLSMLWKSATDTALVEIAKNHHQTKELPFKLLPFAHHIDPLGTLLAKMKTKTFHPTKTLKKLGVVIGGRYCSLLGKKAAFIRYYQSSGRRHNSLYIVRNVGDIKKLQTGFFEKNGLSIRIWREKKMLFVYTTKTGKKHSQSQFRMQGVGVPKRDSQVK